MKRFHVHISVNDLDANIRFYSTLFGSAPTVHKPDYAKWMLEDPRVNFAISRRGRTPGVDHFGLQAEDGTELAAIGDRLTAADAVALAEHGTTCCYAHSDKYWAEDPQGVRWETFHTLGGATTYRAPVPAMESAASAACCGPQSSCCGPKARMGQGRPTTTQATGVRSRLPASATTRPPAPGPAAGGARPRRPGA